MTGEKIKNFRDYVSNRFLQVLEENPKSWQKGWDYSSTGKPINLATNRLYKGVNLFWLKQQELKKGYNDPRWATFKQIQDRGWKLQKGSHGEKVEYWMPIDQKEGCCISWSEYGKVVDKKEFFIEDGIRKERYIIRSKIFTVFNATQIEGVPEFLFREIDNDISPDVIIEKIATGMNVMVEEFPNSKRAYYSLAEDKIHMPLHTQFKSDYAYNSTVLHELGHSTGHSNRLNRKLDNTFGTQKYAFEELIAEITSCFMSEYVKSPITGEDMGNHEAYVQSWANKIRNDKNYLFRAIVEADKASNYMVEKGGLEKVTEKNLNNFISKNVENTDDKKVDEIKKEEQRKTQQFSLRNENRGEEI